MFQNETKWKNFAALIPDGIWLFLAPSFSQKPLANLPPFFGFIFHASRWFIFLADILAEQPAPFLQALQKQMSPLAVFFQIAGAALFHFGTK